MLLSLAGIHIGKVMTESSQNKSHKPVSVWPHSDFLTLGSASVRLRLTGNCTSQKTDLSYNVWEVIFYTSDFPLQRISYLSLYHFNAFLYIYLLLLDNSLSPFHSCAMTDFFKNPLYVVSRHELDFPSFKIIWH